MNKHLNFSTKIIILSACLLFVLLLSLSMGTYQISFIDIVKTLFGGGTKLQNTTIFTLRLPRIAIALLVGICLSTAGCILQSITRNDLAESGMIGINAGASLFVVLLISYGQSNYYDTIGGLALYVMPVVAILGALTSGILIYLLSNKKGINPTRLILTGIGVNVGINAFISIYQLSMARSDYNQVLTWTSGSLWGSSWEFFYLTLPFVIIFIVLTAYKFKVMDALDLGDDLAIGLGVDVNKERRTLGFYAVAFAGLATALAGNIAFLGLISPHIAKRIVGPVHKRLIPASAIISCVIIVFADAISKNLFSPIEIPVGITISIIGVPYFIYLMMKE